MRKVLLGLITATALTGVATAGFAATPAPAAEPAKPEAVKTDVKTEATAEAKEKKDEAVHDAAPAAGTPAQDSHSH